MTPLQQLIVERKRWDTQWELAEAIGVSSQFLGKVLCGDKPPGPKVLDYLGIEKQIVFKRRK